MLTQKEKSLIAKSRRRINQIDEEIDKLKKERSKIKDYLYDIFKRNGIKEGRTH